ncbi:hypothetical protein PC123_g12053 [Phytophthora cactorum]|nr:hypothetical protein PC120_g17353 [Phytophthora cactorum]KAG4052773.1 hypothetical protein PC123_g12053 [Phytophthora cactorum]
MTHRNMLLSSIPRAPRPPRWHQCPHQQLDRLFQMRLGHHGHLARVSSRSLASSSLTTMDNSSVPTSTPAPAAHPTAA